MSFFVEMHRLSTILVMVVLLAACSGPGETLEPGPQNEAEAACRNALRDLRLWCADSILSKTEPGMRFNCLDARLRFDQNCYPG